MKRITMGILLALVSIFFLATTAVAEEYWVQAEKTKNPPDDAIGPVVVKAIAAAKANGSTKLFVIGISSRDEEASPKDPIYGGERSRRGTRIARENGWTYDLDIVASTTFGDSGRRGILFIPGDISMAKLKEILGGYCTKEDLADAVAKLKDYVIEEVGKGVQVSKDYTDTKVGEEKSERKQADENLMDQRRVFGDFGASGWAMATDSKIVHNYGVVGGEAALEVCLTRDRAPAMRFVAVGGGMPRGGFSVGGGIGIKAFMAPISDNWTIGMDVDALYMHQRFDYQKDANHESGIDQNGKYGAIVNGGGLKVGIPIRAFQPTGLIMKPYLMYLYTSGLAKPEESESSKRPVNMNNFGGGFALSLGW